MTAQCQCPRCGGRLPTTAAKVVDGPHGVVLVVDYPDRPHRRECACGWHYTIVSTVGEQSEKGAA